MASFTHQQRITDPVDVLVVADGPDDVRLLREAFERTETDRETRLHVVTTVTDAVALLKRADGDESVPANLVILDLGGPNGDGEAILETIADEPQFRCPPVLTFTRSDDTADVARCHDHVSAYLAKPSALEGFLSLVEAIDDFWLGRARFPPSSV